MATLPSLQYLDLFSNCLGVAAFSTFSSLGHHFSALQKLWLGFNRLNIAASAALATALPQLHALTFFYLYGCDIHFEESSFFSAFSHLSSLRVLDIADNDFGFDNLNIRFSPSLTHLRCCDSNADGHYLIGFLRDLTAVTPPKALDLSRMYIDVPCFAYFSAFCLVFPFRRFSLSFCLTGHKGIRFLSPAFPFLPSLITLSLCENDFDDERLPFPSSSLHHLSSLEMLDISCNAIFSLQQASCSVLLLL